MYFYDRQPKGGVAGREEKLITARPSQRFYPPERRPRIQSRLGEAAAPARGLVLADHFQSPKKPHPSIPGAFVTGPVTKMAAVDLNPGFIDASDNLIVDTSSSGLQTCLQKLIITQFQNHLSNKSNTAPSAGDRIRVALVDLTGDKITRPDFAGWGSTAAIYGASVPKILAVYAAHQLRMDLRNLATSRSISTGKDLDKAARAGWKFTSHFPNLAWLFDIGKWSGNPSTLDFSAAAQKALQGIMHNADAGSLIIKIGFPYIASVTWQSGLYHPTRGGLWLTSSYGFGGWGGNPVRVAYSANLTALSAATYFTLLAQGRLVDDASSVGIKNSLRHGCLTSLFPGGLGAVASKCGIYSEYLHDCALVVRGPLRYVVAGLTRLKPGENAKYTQLFLELDKLVVQNNMTPRPPC